MFRKQSIYSMLAVSALVWTSSVSAQQHAETVSTEAPTEDAISLDISAGGVFNGGNTRSWALNVGAGFRFVHGRHGLSIDWLLAYGRAATRDTADLDGDGNVGEFGDIVTNAQNSNARARYDFFISDNDVAFAALAHRWDPFAGLDTRLQAQVGYLRYFLNASDHQVWGEVGYDFTYDNFDAEDESTLVPDDDRVHSARLYVGYNNELRENVHFTTGIEALFDLEKFFGNGDTSEVRFPGNDGSFGENLRLNFDAGLAVTVVDSLQLSIRFKLLYDEQPVGVTPDVGGAFTLERVDTITTFSLAYTLL